MSQGVGMKRRKIDSETKMAAVLEGLKGEPLRISALSTRSARVLIIVPKNIIKLTTQPTFSRKGRDETKGKNYWQSM
jgi:hypothetical protein